MNIADYFMGIFGFRRGKTEPKRRFDRDNCPRCGKPIAIIPDGDSYRYWKHKCEPFGNSEQFIITDGLGHESTIEAFHGAPGEPVTFKKVQA